MAIDEAAKRAQRFASERAEHLVRSGSSVECEATHRLEVVLADLAEQARQDAVVSCDIVEGVETNKT